MITRHELDPLGGLAAGSPVVSFLVRPGIGTDRETIPTDGSTAALLHFAKEGAGSHLWTVSHDGAATSQTEAATLDPESGLYWSEIEVVSAETGTILVEVGGETIQLEAI